MSEDEASLTPSEIDANLETNYSDLLETNAQIMAATRATIQNLVVIRDAYELQMNRISDLISLHAQGAAVLAQLTGDLLLGEFGMMREDEDEEDEEEEDDEDE